MYNTRFQRHLGLTDLVHWSCFKASRTLISRLNGSVVSEKHGGELTAVLFASCVIGTHAS